MTEKLEELLAAEFRGGRYELQVDADRLSTTLRRRRSRRTAVTAAAAVCGLALVATAGVGMLNVFGPGPSQVQSAGPAPATSAVVASPTVAAKRIRADSVQLGDAVVRGLPAEAKLVDAGAALARPPAVVLPQTGDRAVLTVPVDQGTEIRLAVVADAEDHPGLPGMPDEQDWLGSLGGAHALLTVDDVTDTTYLSVNTPTGRRWHLAASGPDAAARLTLVRAVTVATVAGT
ncbi:hypothetical protein [Actinoplanes sp. NPDC049118]|uniref:hypothetical protein n=1 Tax=Actinoplanes sp. NPDC049118 TaxID=3155769 RepID=UPI00340A82E7